MRILLTGGGTGGHLMPIIAVARELKQLAEKQQILDLEFYYMGASNFGSDLLKEEGIVVVPIMTGKIRRYFSFENVIDIGRVFIGALQAVWNMFLLVPDVVFSKGGYGAFPAIIAAALFRIPIIIHESDAIPGKVNKISARFAARIGIAFASAEEFFPKEKTALVGVPIRKHILGGNRDEAKELMNVFSSLPAVGFLGSSQGARKINEAVLGVLAEMTQEIEVLHQTGKAFFAEINEEASVILDKGKRDHYHSFGFLSESEMRNFFSVAVLIVSRASASAIFEIAAWGKPSILVPLDGAAQDHQRKNAYEYASTGAATVIEEINFTPHILFEEIKRILQNPERMKKMGEAAQRFARVDSAELIAREILRFGIH